MRMKRKATPSKTRTMPAIRTNRGVAAFPAAFAGVEVPVGVKAAAVAVAEGVVLCGVDLAVDAVDIGCCPADALVAVKESLPLTG